MSGTDEDRHDAPNRVPWPPLLYLTAIGIAVLADWRWSFALPQASALRAIGYLGLAARPSISLR